MITVSESALGKLQGLIASQGDAQTVPALRVFVQSGGCSGFSYGMGLDENPPQPEDKVITVGDGLRVYVDSFSVEHLEGAEIDFVDELMGGGFTINNPNAVRTCGCGHSFQTADGAGEAKSCAH